MVMLGEVWSAFDTTSLNKIDAHATNNELGRSGEECCSHEVENRAFLLEII